MAFQRARSPVVWIRRALLTVGLLGVMTLVLLLVAYRFGRTGLDEADGEGRTAAATGEETLTAGEGFAWTHTIEGRQIFQIKAERNLRDRQDTTYLETVIMDIFREGGERYRVTSNNARVNESTREARLEGDVVVSGWGDLVLKARAFDLQQEGRILVSLGAVEFSYPPDFEGRATKLRIDRRSDTISLSGGVHIRSVAGAENEMRLDCERLIYRRKEGLIRALDDVYIRFGDQELRTRALTLFLLEDQKSLRTLRARWDVSGSASSMNEFGGETRIELSGEYLELEPDPATPDSRKVQLVGTEELPAILKIVDPDGLGRTLRAQLLEGEMIDGKPSLIDGHGEPLLIDEFFDLEEPFPLRQVCAERFSARFLADGSLSQIFLERRVELWNRDLYLSGGSKAQLDIADGKVEIEGPEVELFSERGDLAAPRITYSRRNGLIRAEGGVRASLESGTAIALEQSPFGQGKGPIRVESKEAFYTAEPSAFTFLGGVKAWRDQNLLLAEQLRGDQSTQEMAASGGVRTLWFSAPQPDDGPEAVPQAIEVTADLLTYRRIDSTVLYSGNVRVEQDRRTLTCGELAVELEGNGRDAKEMTCRDHVELMDPVENRHVSGDVAVYTVAAHQVEIYGDKVRLVDSQNNRLEGRYLLYNLDTGKVEIKGQAPAAGR